MEQLMSKNPSPENILHSIQQQAAERRQQEADEARRVEERAQQAEEHARRRQALSCVFEATTRCAEEEQLLALGNTFRTCAEAVPEQKLWERLRHAVDTDEVPLALKYALGILLAAAEGNTTAVRAALQGANEDGVLRRFPEWFPFILDRLWLWTTPVSGSRYLRECAEADPPSGTTMREYEQARKAFHGPSRSRGKGRRAAPTCSPDQQALNIELKPRDRDFLKFCRRKAYKGEVIAAKFGLSFDYVRHRLAKLVKNGLMSNGETGYRTTPAGVCVLSEMTAHG
jgi:hypothetical protein